MAGKPLGSVLPNKRMDIPLRVSTGHLQDLSGIMCLLKLCFQYFFCGTALVPASYVPKQPF